jgi:hypothetical protein
MQEWVGRWYLRRALNTRRRHLYHASAGLGSSLAAALCFTEEEVAPPFIQVMTSVCVRLFCSRRRRVKIIFLNNNRKVGWIRAEGGGTAKDFIFDVAVVRLVCLYFRRRGYLLLCVIVRG